MNPIARQITKDIRESVTTSSTTLFSTLYSYSIGTSYPVSNLIIRWNCPYVGNSARGTRSAVRMLFDGEVVTRSMKYNSQSWELHPFVMDATIFGVAAGSHLLEIQARVSGGTVHLPHYNSRLLEAETGIDVVLSLLELPE